MASNDATIFYNKDGEIRCKIKILKLLRGYVRSRVNGNSAVNILIPEDIISALFSFYYLSSLSLCDFTLHQLLCDESMSSYYFTNAATMIHQQKNKIFVIESYDKNEAIALKSVQTEQKILSSIDHPFIINLIASFENEKVSYLLKPYAPCSQMFDFITKCDGKLSYAQCKFYAAQIVLAFEYLHSKKIIHRNLKSESILIDDSGYLRLSGFKFSKILKKPYKTWTLSGNLQYIAPEILLNCGHSFSADWWFLGELLFEMMTGYNAFFDDNPMKLYHKILKGKIAWPMNGSKEHILPKVAIDLMSKLLRRVDKRLGAKNGANDVMKHPFFDGIDWNKLLNKEIKIEWKEKGHLDEFSNDEVEEVEYSDYCTYFNPELLYF